MNSNFSFLADMFPGLEKTGNLAEGYLYTDPNTCLYKLGTFAELIVKYMFDMDGLKPPKVDNTHQARLKMLWQKGLLPRDINDIFYVLRKKRNEAVHDTCVYLRDGSSLLQSALRLLDRLPCDFRIFQIPYRQPYKRALNHQENMRVMGRHLPDGSIQPTTHRILYLLSHHVSSMLWNSLLRHIRLVIVLNYPGCIYGT